MGTTLRAVSSKSQQIIMHTLKCQHDVDVHLLFCFDIDLQLTCSQVHVYLGFSSAILNEGYHFACSAQQIIIMYRISPYISREIYPRTKYYTDNSSYTRVTSSGKKLYRKQVEFSKFGRTMTRQW